MFLCYLLFLGGEMLVDLLIHAFVLLTVSGFCFMRTHRHTNATVPITTSNTGWVHLCLLWTSFFESPKAEFWFFKERDWENHSIALRNIYSRPTVMKPALRRSNMIGPSCFGNVDIKLNCVQIALPVPNSGKRNVKLVGVTIFVDCIVEAHFWSF